MRTNQTARYARWAAIIAVVLAIFVSIVYARRAWQAAKVRSNGPLAVPSTVQQSSAEFAFSKTEGDSTLFTVRASRATEFKDQEKSVLEDVWITIYGPRGERNDNIHTRQCNYEPASGHIACQGEAQLDLESAAEAHKQPGQRAIHVSTRDISFSRETGVATTNEKVTFRFPFAEGHGTGATYRTREGGFELHDNVEITLRSPAAAAASGASRQSPEPVVLAGKRLVYEGKGRTLRLSSAVHAKQGTLELTAATLTVALDNDMRARSAVASGSPKLDWGQPHGQSTLQAQQLTAWLDPEGWAQRLVAEGQVFGKRTGPSGNDDFEAQHVEVEMNPGDNQPREATAQGKVKAHSLQAGGRSQELQTDALRLFFVPAESGKGRKLDHAETLASGTLESKAPGESSVVQAQRLAASFDQHNQIRQLLGHDGVQITRQFSDRSAQTSSSRELVMDFDGKGDWSEAEQSGALHFHEGDRTATAERGKLSRATETAVLTGSATATDSQGRIAAQTIWFNRRTGDIRADGGVSSTSLSTRSTAANFSPEPASVTADHLQANDAAGEALYSGHARMWQGSTVIQSDSIEMFRQDERLVAKGHVKGAFPQAPGPAGPSFKPAKSVSKASKGAGIPAATTSSLVLWSFWSTGLTYSGLTRQATLTGKVKAESSDERIDADTMDLFLTKADSGPAQLDHASAQGHVTVRQGDRWGSGERADYSAPDGKFTLTGGPPALHDASGNIATGRQLTFFLASDKIFIDSDEGSRTLTKHRVEK